MIQNWAQVTDPTGAAVRVVLFDYKMAFDLIDHQILLQKIFSLNIPPPPSIARWVADFLTNRKQRVKLSHDCFSEWGENLLNVLKHQKILGLYISSDLQWNTHIVESIKKADKRMYFLVLLKLSGVPSSDIRNFFCTCIHTCPISTI